MLYPSIDEVNNWFDHKKIEHSIHKVRSGYTQNKEFQFQSNWRGEKKARAVSVASTTEWGRLCPWLVVLHLIQPLFHHFSECSLYRLAIKNFIVIYGSLDAASYLRVNKTSLYSKIFYSKETPETDNSFLIGMIIIGCLMLWMAISLSRRRAVRIRIQDQRWKDIKELEEDYDVYVSDEYAYHINDAKLQMQHMQEFGMSTSIN